MHRDSIPPRPRGDHGGDGSQPLGDEGATRAGLRVCDPVEEMREAKRGRLKPSSLALLEHSFDNVILPAFGDLAPAEVTAGLIERLVRELEKTLKPRSITRYLSPMNELCKRAVQRGAVSTNVWASLITDQRPRPAEDKERHHWSTSDLRALLDAAGRLDAQPRARAHYRPLIATLMFTGARVSEMLALRWQDIDLEAGVITIRHTRTRDGQLASPKTRAGRRSVPIPEPLMLILQEQVPEERSEDGWVFPALDGGQPMSYWNFRLRGFAPALELAGLAGKGITIHDLRHAAASLLIDSGLTDVAVAAQLGHANANVTRAVYAHKFGNAAHQRVREAFESIETTI